MGQIKVLANGQQVILPWDECNGKQLKEQLNILSNRLVTVMENGVTKSIGDEQKIKLTPDISISDAPYYKAG
ncbi:MAG: hypothetical protein ABRQ39_30990 [Candidatus Eremiobacterota bacterium]